MKNYIFKKFNKKKFLEFLRHNTNAENGGYKVYDGSGSHSLQIPEELVWLIQELKKLKKSGFKFEKFLEFGFASGFTNTILNKFFKFKEIVSVDIMDSAGGSRESFFANLRFKNLIFIAGDSRSSFVKKKIHKNGKYDLIFIDGGHDFDVVKNDFQIAMKYKNKQAVIVMHDIECNQYEGPGKLWKQIENNKKIKCQIKKFSCKDYLSRYGIGMLIFK